MQRNGVGPENDGLSSNEDHRITLPMKAKKRKESPEMDQSQAKKSDSLVPVRTPVVPPSTSTSLVPVPAAPPATSSEVNRAVQQSVLNAVEAAKRASGGFVSASSSSSAAAAAAAGVAAEHSNTHTAPGWPPAQTPFAGMLMGPLGVPETGVMHILEEKHEPVQNFEEESLKKPRDVFQSVVECGQVDKNGIRRMTAFSPFFGKEVQIYTAVNDPEKRVLYRASALAEKFNCATNKIGMYLARRRNGSEGIFQATRFKTKPSGRTGLKSGGYFISFAACKAFESHYKQQGTRKARPAHHHEDPQFGNYFGNMPYSQLGANPALLNNYLGYGGVSPTLTPGMAGNDGRFSQFQQQLYMYNQLARLRMSHMAQPGFKGGPPQFPQPQSPHAQQAFMAQLQAAVANKHAVGANVPTVATTSNNLPNGPSVGPPGGPPIAPNGLSAAPPNGPPPTVLPSAPNGLPGTSSVLPGTPNGLPSGAPSSLSVGPGAMVAAAAAAAASVGNSQQPDGAFPTPTHGSTASAAAAAVAAAAAAAAAAGGKPEGDVSAQMRAYQQQYMQNYVLQAQRMAYMQQMYGSHNVPGHPAVAPTASSSVPSGGPATAASDPSAKLNGNMAVYPVNPAFANTANRKLDEDDDLTRAKSNAYMNQNQYYPPRPMPQQLSQAHAQALRHQQSQPQNAAHLSSVSLLQQSQQAQLAHPVGYRQPEEHSSNNNTWKDTNGESTDEGEEDEDEDDEEQVD